MMTFDTNYIYINGVILDNTTITGHDIYIVSSNLTNCTIRYTGNCDTRNSFLSNVRYEYINPDDPAHPIITVMGGNDGAS